LTQFGGDFGVAGRSLVGAEENFQFAPRLRPAAGLEFLAQGAEGSPQDRGVASASVRDGISAAAVVFAPEYGSEDIHQIQSHICSRDFAGSTSPDGLASAA
jgi:hypothetical protein